MRIVLQKVSEASVTVGSAVVSQIKHGYMLLVGIGTDDKLEDIDKLSKKILTFRGFDDDAGYGWKRNISEVDGEILCVSQFTLMARTSKGTKPDFHLAQRGELANELYGQFMDKLKAGLGDDKVQNGVFGAMMSCKLTNEGPVTIIFDSKA
ncbi:D-tyrosyl-tRNA(Tyr) deacylase [Kluyveromyces lactis]|uniref:D-aminoacyl-tRNA deacylase n=1 Tax=Kluyveromyces lactis (strain ATCC 8585 / CBS 2359 / DSM 70799 / NBRC 1267 / NRRL Y-1140 / WM37) TaxID=284590 RepID=DTD_KLULA|nr:uncharacterized protein KLLA0_D08690g [Kluyveromyces lactis]Q6CRI9.1 RecName: Full=D-aminoacyl-tRNA deacylase; Short=DTD; AltName: Full=Gly-tRNA(Ala) deacylase [Kluyveromyces lactis NRRL Y-1140]CAH00546.1 KLLA0D08690p [Kluyveromyces lactis]|eukprot:XP_453450.1 uncharacterized protein KLLA0_D08690g [Kluyveromyces lactis]